MAGSIDWSDTAVVFSPKLAYSEEPPGLTDDDSESDWEEQEWEELPLQSQSQLYEDSFFRTLGEVQLQDELSRMRDRDKSSSSERNPEGTGHSSEELWTLKAKKEAGKKLAEAKEAFRERHWHKAQILYGQVLEGIFQDRRSSKTWLRGGEEGFNTLHLLFHYSRLRSAYNNGSTGAKDGGGKVWRAGVKDLEEGWRAKASHIFIDGKTKQPLEHLLPVEVGKLLFKLASNGYEEVKWLVETKLRPHYDASLLRQFAYPALVGVEETEEEEEEEEEEIQEWSEPSAVAELWDWLLLQCRQGHDDSSDLKGTCYACRNKSLAELAEAYIVKPRYIRSTDGDYRGFHKAVCSAKPACTFFFHASCWSAFKRSFTSTAAKKGCLTDACQGVIEYTVDVSKSGDEQTHYQLKTPATKEAKKKTQPQPPKATAASSQAVGGKKKVSKAKAEESSASTVPVEEKPPVSTPPVPHSGTSEAKTRLPFVPPDLDARPLRRDEDELMGGLEVSKEKRAEKKVKRKKAKEEKSQQRADVSKQLQRIIDNNIRSFQPSSLAKAGGGRCEKRGLLSLPQIGKEPSLDELLNALADYARQEFQTRDVPIIAHGDPIVQDLLRQHPNVVSFLSQKYEWKILENQVHFLLFMKQACEERQSLDIIVLIADVGFSHDPSRLPQDIPSAAKSRGGRRQGPTASLATTATTTLTLVDAIRDLDITSDSSSTPTRTSAPEEEAEAEEEGKEEKEETSTGTTKDSYGAEEEGSGEANPQPSKPKQSPAEKIAAIRNIQAELLRKIHEGADLGYGKHLKPQPDATEDEVVRLILHAKASLTRFPGTRFSVGNILLCKFYLDEAAAEEVSDAGGGSHSEDEAAEGDGEDEESTENCPICYDRFVEAQLVRNACRTKNCDKPICAGCLKTWTSERRQCPYCQQSLLPPDDFPDLS